MKDLDEYTINYSGQYESKLLSSLLSWIIPIGIFFLIWRFAMKKMGLGMGVMSFSKSKAKIFAESEEIVFEEISTGAQNDLQRATDIARSMVTEYGMSDLLGLVTYERPRQPMFLPDSFSPGKSYS